LCCQAALRACQHARKSARTGKHTPNDCRTRRKTNIDTDDGHSSGVSFWRPVLAALGGHFDRSNALFEQAGTAADLAALRRKRNVERVTRNRHREKYNDYMRGYMLRYRARKREAASQ